MVIFFIWDRSRYMGIVLSVTDLEILKIVLSVTDQYMGIVLSVTDLDIWR